MPEAVFFLPSLCKCEGVVACRCEIEAVNELLGERENLEIREVVSSALKVLKA